MPTKDFKYLSDFLPDYLPRKTPLGRPWEDRKPLSLPSLNPSLTVAVAHTKAPRTEAYERRTALAGLTYPPCSCFRHAAVVAHPNEERDHGVVVGLGAHGRLGRELRIKSPTMMATTTTRVKT